MKKARFTHEQWHTAIAERKAEERAHALPHPVVFPVDELPEERLPIKRQLVTSVAERSGRPLPIAAKGGGEVFNEMLAVTAEVVSAYVSNHILPATEVPHLISSVYSSLSALEGGGGGTKQEPLKPAVPIPRSVTPNYIICLDDGKKQKMLKRHLQSQHGMTPLEYRAKWGLPADYPMVAPNYSAARSAFAKKLGLGRKARQRRRRRGS